MGGQGGSQGEATEQRPEECKQEAHWLEEEPGGPGVGWEEQGCQRRNASIWDLLTSLSCATICLVELGGIWNMLAASRNALPNIVTL